MNISPNVSVADQEYLRRMALQVSAFRSALSERFPEREMMIRQLLLCLLTGNNMIIFGVPGTAKTLIANTVFSNIIGLSETGEEQRHFRTQLDGETSVSSLVGSPIIKKLEMGIFEPRVVGYLPDADFAVLDEMLDAPALLRSILEILCEHIFTEGGFRHECNLMTAVGTSNRSPESIIDLYPHLDLAAFMDRFLCVAMAKPLAEAENQYRVIGQNLMGVTNGPLSAQLQFAELQRLVRILKNTNQFPSNAYAWTYQVLTDALDGEFTARLNKPITDRRVVWMTQAVEASALLNGRTNLLFEDLVTLKDCLSTGVGSPEEELFDKVATPIIQKAKRDFDEQVDGAVVIQLDDLEARLQRIRSQVRLKTWPKDPTTVGETIRELKQIENALKGIRPEVQGNITRAQGLTSLAQDLKTTAVDKAS